MMSTRNILVAFFLLIGEASAFTPASSGCIALTPKAQAPCRPSFASHGPSNGVSNKWTPLFMAEDKKLDEGVVELAEDEVDAPSAAASTRAEKVVAPFLSQGEELAEDVLNPDLSDPKQTRVILYVIISLIPVLFLIPLMIGSRDLIPLDALPPVEMTN